MDLRESAAHRELRAELRAYFAGLLPADVRRRAGEQGVGGDRFREIVKMLGNDGWLGYGWPEEYGGQGRSVAEQYVFFDEVQRAGLPFPFVTVNTVGPTLMRFGTDEQKKRFLPGILSGDIVFAIGYTEPDAAPTSPRCARRPSGTATRSSSTAARSSPAAPTPPTTSGSPPGRTRTRPSTRGSRS